MGQFKTFLKKIPGIRWMRTRFNVYLAQFISNRRSCPECRIKDSYQSFKTMVEEVRTAFENENIPFIEHHEKTEEYHFYLPGNNWEEVKKLIQELIKKNRHINVRSRKVLLTPNKYEVDGSSLAIPESTMVNILTQKCWCKSKKRFLKRWNVKIGCYSENNNGRLLHLRNNLVRVLPPGQKLPATLKNLWTEARRTTNGKAPEQLEQVSFPVDVVYTWVNDNDPVWQEKIKEYTRSVDISNTNQGFTDQPKSALNLARYRNREEIRYSLRSIYMYAPFVRNIYVVTDDQVPDWLDTSDEGIEIVCHRDIFDEKTVYPVFSSNPIELNLHKIKGLAEHFIYFNDDVFLCAPINVEDFFYFNGIAKAFFSDLLLDSRSIKETDRATVVSHKNSAAAFQSHFNVLPTRKLLHTAFAARRSICYEVEKVFAEEVKISKNKRFRNWHDVTWPYLVPNYMLFKGWAVPSTIRSSYLDIHDLNLPDKLSSIDADDNIKTACINDTDTDSKPLYEDYFIKWMKRRFPVKAPWEKEVPGKND